MKPPFSISVPLIWVRNFKVNQLAERNIWKRGAYTKLMAHAAAKQRFKGACHDSAKFDRAVNDVTDQDFASKLPQI